MTWKVFVDVIGWIGSLEVVIAYGLISYKYITASSVHYQWLNLSGAIFLIVNTVYYGAYPSAFINVVWLVIAGIAIFNILTGKK